MEVLGNIVCWVVVYVKCLIWCLHGRRM